MDYQKDVLKSAVNFLSDNEELMKESIVAELNFDEISIKEIFRNAVVDREYTPEDALFILRNSERIMELVGGDWKDTLTFSAAESFGNDVWDKAEEMYDDISDKYISESQEIPLSENDIINRAWVEYFTQFDIKPIQKGTGEELTTLNKWLDLNENAHEYNHYGLGESYIDPKSGSGHGIPHIKDFVDYDRDMTFMTPWLAGKTRDEILQRVKELEGVDGTTTIQVSKKTKKLLDGIKSKNQTYENVILNLLNYIRRCECDNRKSRIIDG